MIIFIMHVAHTFEANPFLRHTPEALKYVDLHCVECDMCYTCGDRQSTIIKQ